MSELSHYGVKGMKWGQRKARTSSGSGGSRSGTSESRKATAKKVAKGAGIAGLAVGGAFVAYKLNQNGDLPMSAVRQTFGEVTTRKADRQAQAVRNTRNTIMNLQNEQSRRRNPPPNFGDAKATKDFFMSPKAAPIKQAMRQTPASTVRKQARKAKQNTGNYAAFSRDVANLGKRFPNLQGAELKSAIDALAKSQGIGKN